MKHLIIVGAGGWGREVCWLAFSCEGYGTAFDIKGFVDDNPLALDGLGSYPPILGSLNDYKIESDDVFAISLGNVDLKRKCAKIFIDKGAEFINLIHKSANVHYTAQLGKGVIVDSYVSISANCTVGDFVSFQRFADIGHDSVIGDYCMLSTFSFVGGHSTVGRCSQLATRATVLPGIHVGDHSIVGAGSVAIRNVKDNTTVFGVPAVKVEY